MAVVSCLLFCGITVALCELGRPLYGSMGQSLRTQEKGQALTYRGVLSLAGVIYFAQFKQIGIYGGMNMKKYRTVSCVIIMAIAAIAGFFIGATLDEAMGGAILFSMIAGIACIVYNIENHEE